MGFLQRLGGSVRVTIEVLLQLLRKVSEAATAARLLGMRDIIRQLLMYRPCKTRGPMCVWVWRLGMAAAVIVAAGVLSSGYTYGPFNARALPEAAESPDAGVSRREVDRLRGEQKRLRARLARLLPGGVYIVVDQTNNRLYLRKNGDVLLEAVCSAGSGMVLKESSSGGRKWVFDTPRGSFEVLGKNENPVWRKPDWAFIEEGLPVPDDPSERIEYGALGSYALHFGNGYMIHGTLYERLLGRSVTHGCIRLGRENLRKVYMSCPIGTHIYVF